MKTAVIYLRVSTREQAERGLDLEGYSIPAQRDACIAKATSLDATVIGEYADRGESAKSADRPELQKMLTRIRSEGGIDYVIVHKVDRLARSRIDDAMIAMAVRKGGAKLVSVTENIDETPSGMFLHAIMAGYAEFYALNLATEVLKGTTKKAQAGGTPMRAPIGYLNVRDRVDGLDIRTVALDPERADLIRWAFETYATGDSSVTQLTADLAAKGLTTVPTRKYPTHPLYASNVNQMLQNPYYVGIVSYRGETYVGRHEPLVSEDLFAKVQEVLAAHYKAGERPQRHHHYLKGSLRCDICGSKFTITRAKGHGGTYFYFFCMGRQKYRKGICTQKYLRIEEVEEMVAKQYAAIVFEPERAEAIAKELEAFLAKRGTARKRELARQERRLVQLRTESTKLLQLAYKEAIPDDVLIAEQTRIKQEMATTEAAITAASTSYQQVTQVSRAALEKLSTCERAYREAVPTVKRSFNQTFFKAIFIGTGKKVRVEFQEPFGTMLEYDFMRRFDFDWNQVQEEAEALGVSFGEAESPDLVYSGLGSNYDYLVGPPGLEPGTNGL